MSIVSESVGARPAPSVNVAFSIVSMNSIATIELPATCFVNGSWVGMKYTRSIVGRHELESRAILDLLIAQLQDPAFHYRHYCKTGAVVLWDGHTTAHIVPNDLVPAPRNLTRVTPERGGLALSQPTPHQQSRHKPGHLYFVRALPHCLRRHFAPGHHGGEGRQAPL